MWFAVWFLAPQSHAAVVTIGYPSCVGKNGNVQHQCVNDSDRTTCLQTPGRDCTSTEGPLQP